MLQNIDHIFNICIYKLKNVKYANTWKIIMHIRNLDLMNRIYMTLRYN